MQNLSPLKLHKHRITQSALEVARRSVEAVAMDFTWKVNMFARHAKRTTIEPVDFDLLQAVSPIANIPIVDYAAAVEEEAAVAAK